MAATALACAARENWTLPMSPRVLVAAVMNAPAGAPSTALSPKPFARCYSRFAAALPYNSSSSKFMTTRTRTDVLLLAGFCAFLFFYGLGQFGLIGADEPRYAQVAREMLDRHDWITPTLGGHAWLEKPPLYYWQAMIVYSGAGVSDVTARLPSAMDATLLVLAVYLFFR